ncbi:hypothetical protein [Candidatus Weimeria sp. HCP3S3_B5]|uniref:hypothetical protein n=1 Tax=Candidatus Weimeria sp. HCP3S3_B5 TaxID=3438871 RepID=UPI003F891AFC
MKKIIMIVFAITAVVCSSVLNPVSIKASDIYFTNQNGVTLSKDQYEYLSKFFSYDTLYTMSKSGLESLKDENDLHSINTEKYIRVDEWYDRNGNLVSSTEKEVDKNTAENYKGSNPLKSYQTSHTTSMKKISMQVLAGNDSRIVTITNKWLSIPSTKSYDVLALRPETRSCVINSASLMSAYQKYDGITIGYGSSSENVKVKPGLNGDGGVGISMNIPDSTSDSLESSLTVQFFSGAKIFEVYGTYQHAASPVTLSQSKSYSFSSAGLGNVLYYSNSSIRSKYDNTRGLYLNYRYGEEFE